VSDGRSKTIHIYDVSCAGTAVSGNLTVIFKVSRRQKRAKVLLCKLKYSETCLNRTLTSDTDYHLMAYEPVIDNEHVMHHILLYGCDPKCMYTQLTLLFKTLIHLYKMY
jgi:hypothetical protein